MVREKQWFADQWAMLDHEDWKIEMEEADPLYLDKMALILGFFTKHGTGATSNREVYSKIQKLYGFLSEFKDFKLPNFLNYESRLN